MTRHDDNQLIEWLAQGSEQAFKTVFDHYYTLLCAIAFHYVDDRAESSVIAEDALLSLWEKRGELHDLRSLKAYLLVTTRNRSIDFLRSTHAVRHVSLDDVNPNSFVSDDTLFKQYMAGELELHIRHAIERLPYETRRVFLLSREENLSYPEIAERLGISVNTVKYHIKQALSLLREALRDYLVLWLAFWFGLRL